MKYLRSLYVQVLIGIVLGVLFGWLDKIHAIEMEPLGKAFVNAVKMLIAPIIFATVVHGIAGMGDLKKIGRVGMKALIYFEVVTTLALGIGFIVARTTQPGAGVNAKPDEIQVSAADAKKLETYKHTAQDQSVVGHLMKIIPNTFVSAFAEGEILQVLFLAILAGIALAQMGSHAKPVMDLLHAGGQMFFGIVGLVSKAAPVAAFGAMAYTVAQFGPKTLISLGKLLGSVYLTCAAFIFIVLWAIARVHGFSLWKVLRHIKDELLLTLGTSSSEAALPSLMAKMERSGCSKSVIGIVLPAGYSFNLDGTSIYLTLAALFLAQATNTPLSLGQELTLLLVLMLTSKGAAAVTGGGFITLAATLAATKTVPVDSLALILGIDRFLSEARAITNLIGNTVAMLVVAKWEKEFDPEKGEMLLS